MAQAQQDRTLPSLGVRVTRLCAGRFNVAVNVGLALLAAGVAGVCFTAMMDSARRIQGCSWMTSGWGLLCGLLLATALLLAYHALLLRSFRLSIGELGILYETHRRRFLVSWTEVAWVEEIEDNSPTRARTYALLLVNGRRLKFSSLRIERLDKLARCLRRESDRRGIPWETVVGR